LKLKPYRSARDTIQSGLLLDANESPFSQRAGSIDLNRYPDPQQRKLRSALAAYLGVDSAQLLCAVGSDEVLDWTLKVFCQPGRDSVAITPPTYGMYEVVANILGVEVWEFPLNDDFDFDAASFLQTVPARVKVLILCSPNNPTANLLSERGILSVCRDWNGIVVLDEAYIEFSERPSMTRQLASLPNLILLRTFSKAAGRAGIRLGCAIASPEIITYFSRVKTPYNLNTWTMEEGCRVLKQPHSQQEQIEIIRDQRQRMSDHLNANPWVDKVFPSGTNFVLFRCRNATDIYKALLEKQIVIRDRSSVPGLENCLRVTVGTPSENQRFLHEFNNVVEAMNDD
jgi:histidinol-phosphate aminotransferase